MRTIGELSQKPRNKSLMAPSEAERQLSMRKFERAAMELGYEYIAGIDEVGRGPLAGPVVSAAVILPKDYYLEGLDDSKKLTPRSRDRFFDIIARDAIAWGVGMSDTHEIDEINILNSTIRSMERAVSVLCPQPEYLLIDALTLRNIPIAQKAIIKGDSLSITIAAASVMAKVIRDRLMVIYDRIYPGYNFSKHKGYGTKEHIDCIRELGLCPIHRSLFCHIG